MLPSLLSMPKRRIFTASLVGVTMLLPLAYQLYAVVMVLTGRHPDTPF